jgi:hypothetical protein
VEQVQFFGQLLDCSASATIPASAQKQNKNDARLH